MEKKFKIEFDTVEELERVLGEIKRSEEQPKNESIEMNFDAETDCIFTTMGCTRVETVCKLSGDANMLVLNGRDFDWAFGGRGCPEFHLPACDEFNLIPILRPKQ